MISKSILVALLSAILVGGVGRTVRLNASWIRLSALKLQDGCGALTLMLKSPTTKIRSKANSCRSKSSFSYSRAKCGLETGWIVHGDDSDAEFVDFYLHSEVLESLRQRNIWIKCRFEYWGRLQTFQYIESNSSTRFASAAPV